MTTITQPAKGLEFTHRHFIDENRQPARMRITAIRRGLVYFTYANDPTNKGAWHLDREVWIKTYGHTAQHAHPA